MAARVPPSHTRGDAGSDRGIPDSSGRDRKVMVDVPSGLAAGDYVVLELIDFGGAELVAGQIDFQAK